ncbi:MAG: hypothetical protein HQL38_10845 [Alphaproteobacteria bacterium]|nr:hypothetical protein [Alphaproteobacteria bacterium]
MKRITITFRRGRYFGTTTVPVRDEQALATRKGEAALVRAVAKVSVPKGAQIVNWSFS